jgi:MOSC N-terminal beta barrel domain
MTAETGLGTVVALRRYPVKSMLGEDLPACEVTTRGLVGDRIMGLVHRETGKVASAKNPRLWRGLLKLHATLSGRAVKITFPGGSVLAGAEPGIDAALSEFPRCRTGAVSQSGGSLVEGFAASAVIRDQVVTVKPDSAGRASLQLRLSRGRSPISGDAAPLISANPAYCIGIGRGRDDGQKGGAEHVRAVYRAGTPGCCLGARRSQDAQSQLHWH